ncbi:MAG: beta-lactamase family protein [Roseburia sp.]|nr:beta-lactamase family protein [Roseburia sp.]
MDFSKVQSLMDEAVREHQVPGSDIAVTLNGKIAYRYQNGTSDDEKRIPVKGDELYFLYSATKVITCTAALQLLEKGKISLDDPVSKYIPEYGNLWVKTVEGTKKAEKPLLLKHLFTMTSGLDYNLASESILKQKASNPNSSTLEMVKSFANEPLGFEPGTHYCYSLSHDVLAAVVELVSGISFGQYLKKNIFDICGMEHTGFALNDEARSRMCSQYEFNEQSGMAKLIEKENPFILTPSYESGGAGLISCVDDYCKFVTEMANGNRLLKSETINLMRQDHLGDQAREDFQSVKKGYTYGLGVRTDAAGCFAAKGEFGWDGAAGAYVMIDPDNHIAIFYATHIRNHGVYLYETLHPAIRDAVYAVLAENK